MRNKILLAYVLPSLMLVGCSGNDVSKTLGMQKKAPDEFRVLARPPLTMPPEYNLRPPGEGSADVVAPAEKASVLILGVGGQETGAAKASSAAQSLLDQAGADAAQSDIKQTLDDEYDAAPPKPEGMWEKFKAGTLIKDASEDENEVLDAEKEFERLRNERAN